MDMPDEKMEFFRNRLVKVYRHISRLAKRQAVFCYRIYDHDLPEFPLCIEIYEDRIYLAEYRRRHGLDEDTHGAWLLRSMDIISEVTGIPIDKMFLRERQRKPGRQGQYEKKSSAQEFFEVRESDLRFYVNLSDYLDSGLFLDHRITRHMVREESANRRVLNLFCYTGSFSVYAASGGAASVQSVDLSKTYLDWAMRNMKLNGFTGEAMNHFIHADVMQYLNKLPADYYDLVILDPPTFSNSKRMKDFLDIQRDHVDMINQTLMAMKKGGLLYFSTNFSKFSLAADQIRAAAIKDITKATTPFDFQGKLSRSCFRISR
jgi:23S rRNA (cytosine1962-C5)-methyltransferase